MNEGDNQLADTNHMTKGQEASRCFPMSRQKSVDGPAYLGHMARPALAGGLRHALYTRYSRVMVRYAYGTFLLPWQSFRLLRQSIESCQSSKRSSSYYNIHRGVIEEARPIIKLVKSSRKLKSTNKGRWAYKARKCSYPSLDRPSFELLSFPHR